MTRNNTGEQNSPKKQNVNIASSLVGLEEF